AIEGAASATSSRARTLNVTTSSKRLMVATTQSTTVFRCASTAMRALAHTTTTIHAARSSDLRSFAGIGLGGMSVSLRGWFQGLATRLQLTSLSSVSFVRLYHISRSSDS